MEIYLGVGLLLIVFYGIYTRVIATKNRALEAASSIEVQLQKRRVLIPNVLTLAKKFMEHEKALLTELTALRAQAEKAPAGTDLDSMKQELDLDSQIGSALGNFFAVAENYPELKSQSTITRAQESYEEVEGHIAAARRFYNAAVTDLNNMRETFPMSLVAAMVGVQAMPYFAATEDAKKPVNAADYM
jgi:LemA protein